MRSKGGGQVTLGVRAILSRRHPAVDRVRVGVRRREALGAFGEPLEPVRELVVALRRDLERWAADA